MSDNNTNKMLTDPQFEKLGWQGWHYFKQCFLTIRADYKMYGDIVLEKMLGESKDIYKDAFLCENFEDAIRKIWEERYHYVADTLDDIISLYEKHHERGFFESEYLLPETKKYRSGETKGKDLTFSLSMELYEYIVKEAEKKHNELFIVKANNVYKFSLERIDGFYHKIKLKKLDAIVVE